MHLLLLHLLRLLRLAVCDTSYSVTQIHDPVALKSVLLYHVVGYLLHAVTSSYAHVGDDIVDSMRERLVYPLLILLPFDVCDA